MLIKTNYVCLTLPQSRSQCAGLLNVKPGFVFHIRHQNELLKEIFFRAVSSQQISAKALGVNKSGLKIFFQKQSFGVDLKLYISPLTYKINVHNMHGMRNQTVILTEGLQQTIMYVSYLDVIIFLIGISNLKSFLLLLLVVN